MAALPARCSRGVHATVSTFPLWSSSPARSKPARAPGRTPVSTTLTEAWALTGQASWSGQRERRAPCPEGGHLERSVRRSRDTRWTRTFWKAIGRASGAPGPPRVRLWAEARPSRTLTRMSGLSPSASSRHGNWGSETAAWARVGARGWGQACRTPRPRWHAACLGSEQGPAGTGTEGESYQPRIYAK